jgi:hypothetical protein
MIRIIKITLCPLLVVWNRYAQNDPTEKKLKQPISELPVADLTSGG